MMECRNCGRVLGHDPLRDVEEDRATVEEVVAHKRSGEESFVTSVTDYYCDFECAVEEVIEP